MTAYEHPSVHDGANNSGGKSEGDFPPQRQHSHPSDERLTLGKQEVKQGAGRLWLAAPCSAAPLPRLVCVAWFLLGRRGWGRAAQCGTVLSGSRGSRGTSAISHLGCLSTLQVSNVEQ